MKILELKNKWPKLRTQKTDGRESLDRLVQMYRLMHKEAKKMTGNRGGNEWKILTYV